MDSMSRGTHTRFDFGALARNYDGWYQTAEGAAHDAQQKDAVRLLLPLPARNATLLDVGCGTGHWSCFYASLGFNVIGIDLSRRMLRQTYSHDRRHSSFSVADAYCLPFSDGAFDVVSAMAVLEFVPCAEAVVAEMFRCVRNDGAVVIGVLNRLAPLNRARVAERKEPYSSARLFSTTELRDLLAPYGTVHIRMADPKTEHDERGRNSAFIVAKASRPEYVNVVRQG